MPEVLLHLPLPSGFDVAQGEPTRVRTLAGARVAVLDNGWTSMDAIARILGEELRALGAADVVHIETPHSMPTSKDVLDEVASRVDAAIVGLGN